ncbi:glycosyl hydrolase family 18 protein [Gaetbulibacter sp. M235]|uniref:glycosyl hydrolase family 18 protein n=1 Tax=Gaetbulibacter sp. M235 TaxID=3126510 RepID=UPI00374F8FE4
MKNQLQAFLTKKQKLFLFIFFIVTLTNISAQKVVGGYLPTYSINNLTNAQLRDKMAHLSHLYFFSVTSSYNGQIGTAKTVNGSATFTYIQNDADFFTKLDRVKNVKAWNNLNTKVILVVGGELSSYYLHSMIKNTTNEATYAANLVQFCHANGFDGIDVDWEDYTTSSGTQLKYTGAEYTNLLQKIKSEITAQASSNGGKVLSLSATLVPERYDRAGISGIFQYIDYLQIMSYGGGSRIGNDTQVPISKLDQYYTGWITNLSLPANKYVIGLPVYAKTLSSEFNPTLSTAYKDLITSNPTIVSSKPDRAVVSSFTSGGTPYSNVPFYFNCVNTIKTKGQYVLDNNLKGVMFWEITQDFDYTNSNSLIRAMNEKIPVYGGSSSKTTGGKGTLSTDGIDEEIQTGLKIHPNPFNNLVKVGYYVYNPTLTKIHVFDVNGRLVWENNKQLVLGNNNMEIDTRFFNTGFYIIKIIDGDKTLTRKLIKN